MIVTGYLLISEEAESMGLQPGWLRIANGRIAELRLGELASAPDHGGEDCLISPGMIDAHMHLPQTYSIGAHGMTLLDWLEKAIFPAEAKWADADHAATMTDDVVNQLLAHGTTSFAAYGTVHHNAVEAALRICSERGLRAAVGQVLMDQNSPEELLRPTDQLIGETEHLLQNWPPTHGGWNNGHRVEAAVAPRFAITCSADLMSKAAKLAKKRNAFIETHLAEMELECELTLKLHGGPDYTSVYEKAGLLTPKSIMGHCVWLSEKERNMLAETGSLAAHCPLANTFLRSGTASVNLLKHEGVNIVLGSDIGAGYERSMVRVGRAMLEAAQYVNSEPPGAAEAWWRITTGNADGLGWKNTGRLENNAEADIVIIRPDIPWLHSINPLSYLLFAWDDRWIEKTLVAGRVAWEK